MNSVTGKMLLMQNTRALAQALSLVRAPFLKQQIPLGFLFSGERQYKSMPTHGIGRYRHLVPKEKVLKKKEKVQAMAIKAATATEYGVLNVVVSGYDVTLVGHYSQYVHHLCNRLNIKVVESYALPTKSMEVMVMPEQGTKMYVDVVLKTHERFVQISEMKASLISVFMEALLKNQPEGVQLSVKEHTEADYQSRFKTRPEIDNLLSQMSG